MTSITSLKRLVEENSNERYFNTVLETVNDQVVRLGIMTEPYRWHSHPNSDETFIGVEGTVVIEMPDDRFELTPGTTITIRKGVVHRTSPKDGRSVNLTVESKDMQTVFETK
jgi:mannose-6-phosphate isomerase-like protein (cupin superfamily)